MPRRPAGSGVFALGRGNPVVARPGEGSFFLSGEFHYFRVPRDVWADRLGSVKAAGLKAVSIYVPWNWHVADEGSTDFVGATVAEKDLVGALGAIADAGLECVFRPGPFITAEWRNGGIPDWLLTGFPDVLARDSSGKPATGGNYPAVTYAHPIFLDKAGEWMRAVLEVAGPFSATVGGPIMNIQLDDEPSYFQKLVDPFAVDYNPLLVGNSVGPGSDPSQWARWLQNRHGSLEGINEAHRASYVSLADVAPPREHMSSRDQLPVYMDWLHFKLNQVNEFVAHLYSVVTDNAPGIPISMLFPYLQPLLAGEHARFAEERGLNLQLTNECYLALNAPNATGEHKLGAVVACHEAYNMWRGAQHGPAVTMELQGSNATYIAPGSMEMLYAATVARGIKGINFFMMVGGENPPGFENDTGAHYDACAPVALDGSTRPHYATIAKLARVIGAMSPELLDARPVYDCWLGCWSGYEGSAMAGAALVFDAWGHQVLANMGDMGLADSYSLPALMVLSSVSFGCIDLERGAAMVHDPAIRQLWVPALDFMPEAMQRVLVEYATRGGHLVLLPVVPTLDEYARSCTVLADAVFGLDGAGDSEVYGYAGGWDAFTVVNGRNGESMVAPGRSAYLVPPPDADVLAVRARDDVPCAFSRPYGKGKITFLGFRLQYSPGAGPAQHAFVTSLVEESCGTRSATPSALPLVAMVCAGERGGMLCVVNPVEVPASGRVRYRDPRDESVVWSVPTVLDGLAFDGRGARLLPLGIATTNGRTIRHATWELIGGRHSASGDALEFSVPPGMMTGEIVVEGPPCKVSVEGGRMEKEVLLPDGATAYVVSSYGPEVTVVLSDR